MAVAVETGLDEDTGDLQAKGSASKSANAQFVADDGNCARRRRVGDGRVVWKRGPKVARLPSRRWNERKLDGCREG